MYCSGIITKIRVPACVMLSMKFNFTIELTSAARLNRSLVLFQLSCCLSAIQDENVSLFCSSFTLTRFPRPSRSAHLISRYRPRAPILAVTRNAQTARQAHLYRGIFPVLYTNPPNDVWAEDVDMRVNFAMEMGGCLPAQLSDNPV